MYQIDVKYNESAEFKSGMQKLGQIMTKYLITLIIYWCPPSTFLQQDGNALSIYF